MAIKSVVSEIPSPHSSKVFSYLFESLDEQFVRTIRLPFNPESTQNQVQPNWEAVGASGAERDRLNWKNNTPEVVSWTHIIQAKDFFKTVGGEVVVDIERYTSIQQILTTMKGWATRPTAKTREPTKIRLTRGEAAQLIGNISAFSWRPLKTGTDGVILTAEYEITFTENEE